MIAVDKNSFDYEIAATVCGFTPNLVDMFALKVVNPPPQLLSVRIVVLSGVDGNIYITIFAHAENQNLSPNLKSENRLGDRIRG
jgi:hypothetical protein